MKIVVTGSAGFIGSHLVEALEDHQVFQIDKLTNFSTAEFDVLLEELTDFKPKVIVHLGANCSSQISLRDPLLDFTDNVVGTFNMAEVARRLKIPVIFNSTMKIYPGEDGLLSPYGMSKLTGEHYLGLYHDLYGLDYIINRPSSVYGPGQNASEDGGWFTWFIQAAAQNKEITLFGDGTQSRDVLYIDDHIELLLDQIKNFDLYKNKEFDFGGGLENEVSLNQLLDELNYHNTKTAPRLYSDVQRFVNDNKQITKINGWKPKTNWIRGLKLTQESFK